MEDTKEKFDKVKDVSTQLAEKLEKDKVAKNVEKLANFMRSYNVTMGGKGANACVEALVGLGKLMPYIGAAAAVGSLILGSMIGEQKSDEMRMLESISDQISDLQKTVDKLPGKIKRLFEEERVEKAVNDIKSCQHSLKLKNFKQMAHEISDVKHSINALQRLLTDRNIMAKLAEEAGYKPGTFMANVSMIVTPYMEGVKLVCAFDTHEIKLGRKWTMRDIDKQCQDTKKEFNYDMVFESIRRNNAELSYLHSGDEIMMWNESCKDNWLIVPDRKKWALCLRSAPETKVGSVVILVEDDSVPEEASDISKISERSILTINDLVAISSYGEYIYRYAGNAFGANAGYCCYTETKSDAKYQGNGMAAMRWKLESATGKQAKEKIKDGDRVYLRCYQHSAGSDCYLTCGSDGYVTTSSSKQVYRMRSTRLMSEEEAQVLMYGSVEKYKEVEKTMEEMTDACKQM